jgi:hypothetical protein
MVRGRTNGHLLKIVGTIGSSTIHRNTLHRSPIDTELADARAGPAGS